MTMSEQLWQIAVGVALGALARFALPGKNPGGLITSMIAGVAGAFLGAFLGLRMGWFRSGENRQFLMVALGSAALIAVFRFLSGTTAKPPQKEDDDL
jgi:uncharacterized membrane protein YeaQ/YmgE (transglycosylase-associated protein family)